MLTNNSAVRWCISVCAHTFPADSKSVVVSWLEDEEHKDPVDTRPPPPTLTGRPHWQKTHTKPMQILYTTDSRHCSKNAHVDLQDIVDCKLMILPPPLKEGRWATVQWVLPACALSYSARRERSSVSESVLWRNWKPAGPTQVVSLQAHIQHQQLSSWVIDRDLYGNWALGTQHFKDDTGFCFSLWRPNSFLF